MHLPDQGQVSTNTRTSHVLSGKTRHLGGLVLETDYLMGPIQVYSDDMESVLVAV